MGPIKIRWTNVIGDGDGRQIAIEYGDPLHLDWSSLKTRPQPIEVVMLEFDPRTAYGRFTPIIRS